LGRTGKSISAIALGTGTFGREIDEEDSYRIMDYCMEKGITFFDTAEAYGGGQARENRRKSLGVDDVRETTGEMSSSERMIGSWMRARGVRGQVTLCTKISGGRGRPEDIRKALAASLDRLQTDRVDVYKMHQPDLETPIDETLDAMTAEKRAGRISTCIGGANYDAAQMREALDTAAARGFERFEITQPNYNLAVQEAEDALFPLCIEEEIAVTSYSPLGAGFLTGKYTPDRTKIPARARMHVAPAHIDIYFNDRSFRIMDRLEEKSVEMGVPVVRLAMAWAMTHPAVTAVLVGARETRHIDNAIAAYDMGLDPDLRAEMSAWS
jgi:aryl-alcohol dehydrogenase-like predicted oxidoreductase